MPTAGKTHHVTIENTDGSTKTGFMLSLKKPYGVLDAQTIAPRILTEEQITQSQLPPDLALTFPQTTWRHGIGGLTYRLHPEFLADAARIDVFEEGVLKLARLTTATTDDSAPDEYVPSGFAVSGQQMWSFQGRDAYSWDFTNKNWDIGTEPVSAARIFRNAVNYAGVLYSPSWADDAGSGGSYTASDEPVNYIHKTLSAAQWTLISQSGQTLSGCKYMAVADDKLWGGYWASAADSGITTDGPIFDATSSSRTLNASSLTFSLTVGNKTNRLIVVCTQAFDTVSVSNPTGVTYDGVAMVNVAAATTTSLNKAVSIWTLVAPATGANNVVVTWGDTHDEVMAVATSFQGVNQSSPVLNGTTANGTSTTPSVAVTTVAGDMVIDSLAYYSATVATVGAGQTQRGQENGTGASGAASTERAVGVSTTMSWTTPNIDWLIGAVSIKPHTPDVSDTTIEVSSTPSAQFAAGDVIRVESELMLVGSVNDVQQIIQVVRGYRGTAGVSHATLTAIYEITEDVHHVRSCTDGTALANWSTVTTIGDSGSPITALVGVANRLVIIKTDGIYTLEDDGTVTNRLPGGVSMGHADFGRGAWGWNDMVYIPLQGGGLWELETTTWTIRDISLSNSIPDQSQYHGRVVAGTGEPSRLYIMVLESANTRYHILASQNPGATGFGDYNWGHVTTISYTTGTDANHAALLLASVTSSGSVTLHRLLAGVESTGSNLLPYYTPHSTADADDEYSSTVGEVYTVAFDGGFPNINKRAQSIAFNTANLGVTAGTHHQVQVRYRIDGGAWTYITGSAGTSTLTTANQTLTFASAITFKKIELRFTLTRKTTGDVTTPEVHDFTFTCQMRTAAIKLLPLVFTMANGQRLLTGMPENQAKRNRDRLRTWDTQAAELVLRDWENQARTCISVPGSMREYVRRKEQGRLPEYEVHMTFAEVG